MNMMQEKNTAIRNRRISMLAVALTVCLGTAQRNNTLRLITTYSPLSPSHPHTLECKTNTS